jgi:hypothetical protein
MRIPQLGKMQMTDATHLALGIARSFLQDSSGTGVSQEKQSRSP